MIRRERRGPYKKYLTPGNETIVPNKTIQYHKQKNILEPRPGRTIDLEQRDQPSTSRTTSVNITYTHSHDNTLQSCDESEGCEIGNESDISVDSFLSDESLHCNLVESDDNFHPTDSSDDENFHHTDSSDDDTRMNPELNEIVAAQCNKSKFEILLLILTYSIRHSLSTVAIIDLIKLINSVLGRNVLPQSKYWLTKIFHGGITFTNHLYCPKCMTYIGAVPSENKSDYAVPCPSCPDHLVVYSMNNDNPSVFVTISMAEQLKTLFESRKDIQMNLNYRNERVAENGKIQDILDGLAYQKLRKQNGLLSDDNNFSITFNTDGAPVFKSSKCSVWPLQFFLNELPPNIRYNADNILLGGLWFGSKEPRMDVFMIPFVEEALKLETHGIVWNKSNGEKISSKFVFLCCCLDSVARPMVQGIKQFNGYFGCAYCLHPGENVEGNQVRFTSCYPPPEERNDNMIRQNMKAFAETNLPVNGVKSVSPLIVLTNFDLVFGFVLDYMHCILLGVTRFMTNLWLDSANHNYQFYIGPSVGLIDNRIEKILPPSTITRNPRPISMRCHWKANEWRNWLLFYSLPCLKGILHKRYFDHYAVLVGAIFILLQDNIPHEDIDKVHFLLQGFVLQFEELYGKRNMTYNVHLLNHVGKHVSLWGPLWAYSAFVFESGNKTFLKLIKGTTDVGSQIITKYLRYSSIPRLLQNYMVQDVTLQTCSQIMSVPLLKKVTKLNKTILLGLPGDELLTEDEISAFLEKEFVPTSIYYKRILFGNTKYSCELYRRQIKNCDYIAYLNCKTFVVIKRFVVINEEIYILCSKIKTKLNETLISNVSDMAFCHLKICQTDVFENKVCLKLASELCGLALLISVNDFKYVSIFPKFYEKD